MNILKELNSKTTHVVITFVDHEDEGQLQTEMVPARWVFREKGKWWCLFPSASEYRLIEGWNKKEIPPKKNWSRYEVRILGQSTSFEEAKLQLTRSYTRPNVEESTGVDSEADELELAKKKEEINDSDSDLYDIPQFPDSVGNTPTRSRALQRKSKSSRRESSRASSGETSRGSSRESRESSSESSKKVHEKSHKTTPEKSLNKNKDKHNLDRKRCASPPEAALPIKKTCVAMKPSAGNFVPDSSRFEKSTNNNSTSRKNAVKDATKTFEDAATLAEYNESPYLVNLWVKGFKMISAKLDHLQRSLQYDVHDGYKKINTSIAISGQNSVVTLADLKLKLEHDLPIKDVETFEKFNDTLSNEENKKACITLIKALAFGAKHENDAIDSVLKEFISKNVQLQYSGKGRQIKGKAKKDFSATKLCSLTIDVLMPQFKTTKEKIMTPIGRWLSWAADREGGRKQRGGTDQTVA